MSSAIEIAPGVHWVGEKHRQLKVFDELFPTHNGTTYNSYLVQGREKIALIDTVKGIFAEDYLEKLQKMVPLSAIDIVVVNHTEPDHSGALSKLLEINPDIEVYATRAGENFLRQLVNRPINSHVVAEGEEIDLGGKTLRFIMAPSLHWPDTMFTYLQEDRILFPCDAFGAHFCAEGLYDDEIPDFSFDFHFYFDCIMRPFKDKVREAVAKVENLEIKLICPSHGPLLRKNPKTAIDSYKSWSAAPPVSAQPRALVLVLSSHDNTREMASAVRLGLEDQGLDVVEMSMCGLRDSDLRDELERCDLLLVGSPTINRDAPGPVWHALSLISSVTPKGKLGAVFGSYGWSGEAVKMIEERLKGLKYTLAAEGICFRFKPTEENIRTCQEFGAIVARVVLGQD